MREIINASEENWYTYLNRVKMVDEKYAPIMGKLYISKVNKNPKDISEYRRLIYQLLTALALSKQDYVQLLKEDMRVYKKIIKPFDKDAEKDEWITNIDYIRLFFKNIVSGESDEELEDDIRSVSENVVTKCEALLDISENFVKLKYVKKQLAKLIEKRCRDLACGKITVKARYPIEKWEHPTAILYGGKDNLQPIESIQDFANTFEAKLTVSEESEHPFMASKDYGIVEKWITDNI